MRKTSLVITSAVFLLSFHMTLETVSQDARADTIHVGGIGPGNYTVIQDAIDSATAGDTVFVHKGTYHERVRILTTISLIGEDRDATIIDGGGSGNVFHIQADWVNITDFTIKNAGFINDGITLSQAQNCTVANNTIEQNYYGISVSSSYNNRIANNTISQNSYDGISLGRSNSNLIEHNNISDNDVGLDLSHSDYNEVVGNFISLNDLHGISIEDSHSNIFSDNTVSNNRYHGIVMSSASSNLLTGNMMSKGGLLIRGDSLEFWNSQTISTSNTVNGKAVHYWKDTVGGIVPQSAGQVLLANCTDVIVSDQHFSNGSTPIQIGFSSNIIISNNTVLYNLRGIDFYNSTGSLIAHNNVSLSRAQGIWLDKSTDNTLIGNSVSMNVEGVHLQFSHNCTIAGNTILKNEDNLILHLSNNSVVDGNVVSSGVNEGISLRAANINTISNNTISENFYGIYSSDNSGENTIYHNNLMDNQIQAHDFSESNQWDGGYPAGGNYWSDYDGRDEKSGPSQSRPAGDGIGDTSYGIPEGTDIDRYPLMSPFVAPPAHEGNQPSVCTIDTPIPGTTLSGIYSINGTASDMDGSVKEVEIRIDERPWIEVTGTTSWTYEWDSTVVDNGEHTIHARSFDGTDYSNEVSVTVTVENAQQEEPEDDWLWLAVGVLILVGVVIFLFS